MYRVESKYTWNSTAKNYITGILDAMKKKIESKVETNNQFCRAEDKDVTLQWLKEIYFE
jgi:hypothetical protein